MAKTVLIVDDIEFVRKTLSNILTQAHYQVVGEAADGMEAIKQYQKLRPDIVTMDIVMPQLSGIEAARHLIKMDRQAKIVIITAMGQENLLMEAINVGVKDYILKPFTAQDVVKTLDRILASEQKLIERTAPREKNNSSG